MHYRADQYTYSRQIGQERECFSDSLIYYSARVGRWKLSCRHLRIMLRAPCTECDQSRHHCLYNELRSCNLRVVHRFTTRPRSLRSPDTLAAMAKARPVVVSSSPSYKVGTLFAQPCNLAGSSKAYHDIGMCPHESERRGWDAKPAIDCDLSHLTFAWAF